MTGQRASTEQGASTGQSASTGLRGRLALAAPTLDRAARTLWTAAGPDDLRGRYLRYLTAMHALITASVPLLERAADRCGQLHDACAPLLADYFARHAQEERGHDDWLLEDLAAASGSPEAAKAAVPPPLVVELAGAQYYRIEHRHPVALLGYIAVLEGNAPAPGLADRLAADTGLPAAAFRTLREHAALDTGHLDDLCQLLDALPLTAQQQLETSVCALHTADTLTRLFLQLAADQGGRR